jgi:DNA repair protein RadA/Sms
MAKIKTAYVCTECGADFTKWQGQCSACQTWNSLQEFKHSVQSKAGPSHGGGYAGAAKAEVIPLNQVDLQAVPRFSSSMAEFDRVLGGGLVPGSVILIGGHPGAGKSTLLLQSLCHLAQHHSVLYVTGEESLQQVAMRAQRLQLPTDNVQMLAETDVNRLLMLAQQHQPKIMVVDSIQVMQAPGIESAPGSVSQVRESAAYLTRYAKQTQTVVLLVGHVTKDGSLAGPKVLEHMIDCSIMLEGNNDSRFRTLRGIKNRFGAINELGVFAMMETGLKEVKNPSSIFLSRSGTDANGSLVTVIWEGTRPLLLELQALVDDSHFGNPRRVTVGLDHNRLSMLLAVMHRHGGIHTGDQDVFVNVVGGVRVTETSADLALLLAILSSLRNRPFPRDWLVFGEVGLSGEIRPVPSGQERLKEAAKHGFKKAIAPIANIPKQGVEGLEIVAVQHVKEALELV